MAILNQQATQQQMPLQQAPQQQGPQQGQAYPQNNEQVQKFVYGIIQELHGTEHYGSALADQSIPLHIRLGALASMALANMFTRVKQQTNLPVDEELVLKAIHMVVSELAEMAQAIGEEPANEDLQKAAEMAGDNLDETMKQVYGGGGNGNIG